MATEYYGGDQPLPAYDYSLAPMPCYHCGAVTIDGMRAVYKTKMSRTYTMLRCRACGKSFQLPRRTLQYSEILLV